MSSINIQQDYKNIRGVFAFPSIEDFYDVLMDRLHMVLGQFFLEERFTIFINALPRDHEVGTKIFINRFNNISLAYVGLSRQRDLLESVNSRVEKLDVYWQCLKGCHLNFISSPLYQELSRGDYALEDIEQSGSGWLKDYFKPKINPELNLSPLTEPQEAEFQILNYHFNIETYLYISLPLIQFAEFDGVVHIICSEADYRNNLLKSDKRLNLRVIGNLIKAFSREYEGLILDWNIVENSGIIGEAFLDAMDTYKLYSEVSNPILLQLGYKDYYLRHRTYFEDRIGYNKIVSVTPDFIETYWDIPSELQITFQQSFYHFIRLAEKFFGTEIYMKVTEIPTGLKLVLINFHNIDIKQFNSYLKAYYSIINGESLKKFEEEIKKNLSEEEINSFAYQSFFSELEYEINALKYKTGHHLGILLEDKNRQIEDLQIRIRFFESQQKDFLDILKNYTPSTQKTAKKDDEKIDTIVRKYIEKGNIEKAIEELGKFIEKENRKDLRNYITLFSAKYHEVIKQKNMGNITFDDFMRQKASIESSILDLLKEID